MSWWRVSSLFYTNAVYLRNWQYVLCCQDVLEEEPWEVTIHFLDEQTSEESAWMVAMETQQSQQALQQAIREPWQQQFGVDLQINLV